MQPSFQSNLFSLDSAESLGFEDLWNEDDLLTSRKETNSSTLIQKSAIRSTLDVDQTNTANLSAIGTLAPSETIDASTRETSSNNEDSGLIVEPFSSSKTPVPILNLPGGGVTANSSGPDDTTYVFTGDEFITITDLAGIDTFDFSNTLSASGISIVDGDPQGSSTNGNTSNIQIAAGTIIENVIGSDTNNSIIGNDVDNNIQALGGDDFIFSALGDDTVDGGLGNDTYFTFEAFADHEFGIIDANTILVRNNVLGYEDTVSNVEIFDFFTESFTLQEIKDVATITFDPEAIDDAITVDEDFGPVDIEVLLNDSHPLGEEINVVSFTAPSQGTVIQNGNVLTYESFANANGIDTFTYTVEDLSGRQSTATVNVTINPINDAPVAGDLAFSVDEDNNLILTQAQLLSAASDVDVGDSLTALNVQSADSNITVTDNGDGTFTLTPADDFNGEIDLTYDVTDGQETVTANIDLTVNPINDAPVAGDLAFSVDEDNNLILTQAQLLSAASDVDVGDSLTALNVQSADSNITVTDNGDGTFTLTPADDFNGEIDLTYDVTDGQETVTANIDLTVNPINDAPVAGDLAFSVDEDNNLILTQAQLLSAASDVDVGDSLTALNVQSADSNITVTDNGDGTFTLTPADDFNGEIDLTYDVTDGQETVTANIDLTVNPINDAPVAGDLAFSVDEDNNLILTQAQLLSAASDVDVGDSLTALNVQSADSNITVTDNGDGTFTLTPADDFNGEIDLTYDVTDGQETVTANIDLTVNPINDAPVAGDLAFSVDEDNNLILTQAQLLSAASDVDVGDSLTALNVQSADSNITVTDNGDGTFTLTPADDFNGEIDLTYDVTDGQETVTANIDLTVNPINDAPVANPPQDLETLEDVILGIASLGITDIDTDSENIVMTIKTIPSHGTLSLNGVQLGLDSTFTLADFENGSLTFSPGQNENDDVSFSFDVTDGTTTILSQIVPIDVQPVDDGFAAVDNNIVFHNKRVTFDATANADNPDGQTLTVASITPPNGFPGVIYFQHGTGLVTVEPHLDYYGDLPDFEVTLTNGTETSTAKVIASKAPPAPTLEGTADDDVLSGTASFADVIVGQDGNDILYGFSGKDILDGGNGDDIIHAGSGSDIIFMGEGNDIVFAGHGNDVISTGTFEINPETGNNFSNITGPNHDIITTGGGFDEIVLTELNKGNTKTITDFSLDDVIRLDYLGDVFLQTGVRTTPIKLNNDGSVEATSNAILTQFKIEDALTVIQDGADAFIAYKKFAAKGQSVSYSREEDAVILLENVDANSVRIEDKKILLDTSSSAKLSLQGPEKIIQSDTPSGKPELFSDKGNDALLYESPDSNLLYDKPNNKTAIATKGSDTVDLSDVIFDDNSNQQSIDNFISLNDKGDSFVSADDGNDHIVPIAKQPTSSNFTGGVGASDLKDYGELIGNDTALV